MNWLLAGGRTEVEMSLNIAFAGFRHDHIYGLYLSAVQCEEVNIIGCYEEDAQARKKAEEVYNITFSYQSYKDILCDKNVDAIAIGDYYGKRGKMVIEALEHDKHVICDKPICTDLSELDEIEKLVDEKNLKVCCMLDLRYMPQVSTVKKMIENNELGDIRIVSFTGQHYLNYGNRPGWYFENGKHGGTINDIAIHGIDLIRFITGKNLTKINCVKTWNAFADKEPDFKDCGQLMIEMDSISVMADVSYAAPKCGSLPTYWDFYFWGTKGMLNFRLKDNLIHVYKEKEAVVACEEGGCRHLEDFVKEISGSDTILNTNSILKSQRQVLMLQKNAGCWGQKS